MARSWTEAVAAAGVTEHPSELQQAIFDVAAEMRETEVELRKHAMAFAITEDNYRMRKATEMLRAEGKTVAEKQAAVDLLTSKERIAAHSAEHMKGALIEISRSQRQRMSALQSLLQAQRLELELAGRYESKDLHQNGGDS